MLRDLLAALGNSRRGLLAAARSERAVRQELALLVLGVPAALALGSALWVRVALVGSLILVLAAELLNTAIEKLCDHLHPGRDPAIGLVKDLGSAGAFCAQGLAALIWAAAVLERLLGS